MWITPIATGRENMKKYDVIIVGAGPSGSTCASYCAKKGMKTLLLDRQKFPREKVCGDAISGQSTIILRELELTNEIESMPHKKIWGVIFSGPNGNTVEIPILGSREEAPGYTCKRIDTDMILLNNAKKFCDVIEEFTVSKVERTGEKAIVSGKHSNGKEESFEANMVVAADGAMSGIAKEAGMFSVDPKHHCTAVRTYYKGVTGMTDMIELHFVDDAIPGYFWIFPMGNGEANVGLGMITEDMTRQKVKLNQLIETVLKSKMFKKRFEKAEALGPLKGWTLPFGSRLIKMHSNRLLLIGDAASLIDPFTGEGVGNALHSGKLAAEVCAKAHRLGKFDEETLAEYQEKVKKEICPDLQNSYNLQKLGKVRFLLNMVINKAKSSKKLRDTISSMLIETGMRKQFEDPLFYLKIMVS